MEQATLAPRATGLLAAALLVVAGCGDRKREAAPASDVARDAPGGRIAHALDEAGLAALAAVAIAGHRIEVARRGAGDFGAVVTGVGEMKAVVTISRCARCAPLEVAAWERDRASWLALLAPAAGDQFTIERVVLGPFPLIELRARRTIEGVAEAVVQAHWNDGSTQLWVSCEQAGGDEAEQACAALVAFAATAYLPVLAP